MANTSEATGTLTPHEPSVTEDLLYEKRSRLIQALLDNETGVRFESLVLFAEPLFSLYEVDAGEAFQLYSDPEAVSDETIALLETARILWAFFTLPPDQRAHARTRLATQLIGEAPTDDEWIDLEGLIDSMTVHWKALLDEEIREAEATDHPTLAFRELLQHDAFRIGGAKEQHPAGFGPDALSETEARARFAQPLFESREVLLDADAFERAVHRSDALWTLAHTSNGNPEAQITAYAREYSTSESEHKVLEDQARAMIKRYRELFPERARKPE